MTRHSMAGPLACAVATAALLNGMQAAAQTTDRWLPVDREAVATLPAPSSARGIVGARLACAEQAWTLALDLAPGSGVGGASLPARVTIGAEAFSGEATIDAGKASLPLPRLAIAQLKTGTSARVTLGADEAPLQAAFSLRGSKLAIEAAEPLCSKRNMSDYEAVALSPYSSYALEGRDLRKEEIALFRTATTAEPAVAAARSTDADGRSLTFVELCGSSWYYGASGCNVAIFARTGENAPWTLVYDAEGADLYLDRSALVDGWPGIIALPRKGGGDAMRWTWGGSRYVVADGEAIAEGPHGAETAQ